MTTHLLKRKRKERVKMKGKLVNKANRKTLKSD